MKNLMLGFMVLIGGALTLASGCGDDSDDGGSTGATGGTAGKGGSTTGGKGGTQPTGGSDGEGGAGNASSGGDSSGGTSTEGGTGTGGAMGGAPSAGAGGAGFMNPEGCPDAAPGTGDDCTVDLELGTACEYAGSSCVCNGFMEGTAGAGGAGMAGNWICRGDGADCPEATPANEDDCDQNGQQCPYPGGIECFCGAGNWDCAEPGPIGAGGAGGGPGAPLGECPEVEPGDGDDCSGPILNCSYEETDTLCSCPGNGPDADEWNCLSL